MGMNLQQQDDNSAAFISDLTGTSMLDIGKASLLPDSNTLRIAANVADGETITIGNDTYEFDRAESGVTAGNIAITGHADDTPANATDAVIAAINANATEPVEASDIGLNQYLVVVSKTLGDNPISCTETMAGTNNAWNNATLVNGGAAKKKEYEAFTYSPSALEASQGYIHIPVSFTPSAWQVFVLSGSDNILQYDGAVTFTATAGKTNAGYMKLGNSGSVDWDQNSTIHVVLYS